MPNITIQLDTNVQRLFDEGKRRGLDTACLMADIGETLLKSTQQRFATGVAPDGTTQIRWAITTDGVLQSRRLRTDPDTKCPERLRLKCGKHE